MADRGHRQRLIIGSVIGVAILGYLLWFPQQQAPADVRLWTTALYFGIAAMGLNLLTGYNGQVSIGHGAFFGIGAYTTAILVSDHGWSLVATIPVAAALAFVVGVAVGVPALRVKGLYLALVTLGLAVVFPDLTKKFVRGVGGTNLVRVPSASLQPPAWVPGGLASDQWGFYLALTVSLLLLLGVWLLVRGRFGRALIAVRDHEAAATTVGVNLARTKVLAFALSALYAGVAGSLSVQVTGIANAEKIGTFNLSILFLVAVVIGGTATVVGPLIGGFLVVMIQEWTTDFVADPPVLADFLSGKEVLSPAIFGVLLIVLMYFLPDGIVGGFRRLLRRFVTRRRDPTGPEPLTAPVPT
ncbi:MAG: branched-chain amino acid ABC transporter permease [Actinomycetes bacterium]